VSSIEAIHRRQRPRAPGVRWTPFEQYPRFESVGDAVDVASARVRGLARFKDFIEQRGREIGAWRGSINAPHA
jgi:hypothetical protein